MTMMTMMTASLVVVVVTTTTTTMKQASMLLNSELCKREIKVLFSNNNWTDRFLLQCLCKSWFNGWIQHFQIPVSFFFFFFFFISLSLLHSLTLAHFYLLLVLSWCECTFTYEQSTHRPKLKQYPRRASYFVSIIAEAHERTTEGQNCAYFSITHHVTHHIAYFHNLHFYSVFFFSSLSLSLHRSLRSFHSSAENSIWYI